MVTQVIRARLAIPVNGGRPVKPASLENMVKREKPVKLDQVVLPVRLDPLALPDQLV